MFIRHVNKSTVKICDMFKIDNETAVCLEKAVFGKKLQPILHIADGAMASSVSFANFTFTTIPYAEKWERVTSKVKVDNEQNWYLTLTQKSELDSKEVRALAISNDVDPAMQGLNPYPLKSTTTSSGAIKYQKQVTKNRTYSLYVSGNENVSKPHKIVISGRYTS